MAQGRVPSPTAQYQTKLQAILDYYNLFNPNFDYLFIYYYSYYCHKKRSYFEINYFKNFIFGIIIIWNRFVELISSCKTDRWNEFRIYQRRFYCLWMITDSTGIRGKYPALGHPLPWAISFF